MINWFRFSVHFAQSTGRRSDRGVWISALGSLAAKTDRGTAETRKPLKGERAPFFNYLPHWCGAGGAYGNAVSPSSLHGIPCRHAFWCRGTAGLLVEGSEFQQRDPAVMRVCGMRTVVAGPYYPTISCWYTRNKKCWGSAHRAKKGPTWTTITFSCVPHKNWSWRMCLRGGVVSGREKESWAKTDIWTEQHTSSSEQ